MGKSNPGHPDAASTGPSGRRTTPAARPGTAGRMSEHAGFLEDRLQSGVAALYLKSAPVTDGSPDDPRACRTEHTALSEDAGV